MKKSNAIMKILPSLCVAAIIITTASWAGAGETGGKTLDEARLAVDKSSLTKDAKLDILTKADRAVKAGIPSEDAAIIITRGLRQGADSKSIAGFLETATRVKEQNLPVRPILDRIEQGLAKGVPTERIVGVAQRLSGNLTAARPMVEKIESRGVKPAHSGSSADAIETVARALEKSIPENAIVRTGEKVKEQKGSITLFDKAVDTMTTFAANGMTADQASRLVQTALGKGYSERDLEKMEEYMIDELRKGRNMESVVSNMESGMDRGKMREGQGRTGGGQMRDAGHGMGGPRR